MSMIPVSSAFKTAALLRLQRGHRCRGHSSLSLCWGFRPDDQRRLVNSGFKKSFHDIHGENKSRACRRDIEGNCIHCPDGRLNTAGIAGIIPVRGRSPENDDIQLFRGNSCCRKRPLSCLRRQMARSLSGGDPAFRIPVRVRIHSSFVSTIFDRSSFVIKFSGTYAPIPAILAVIIF